MKRHFLTIATLAIPFAARATVLSYSTSSRVYLNTVTTIGYYDEYERVTKDETVFDDSTVMVPKGSWNSLGLIANYEIDSQVSQAQSTSTGVKFTGQSDAYANAHFQFGADPKAELRVDTVSTITINFWIDSPSTFDIFADPSVAPNPSFWMGFFYFDNYNYLNLKNQPFHASGTLTAGGHSLTLENSSFAFYRSFPDINPSAQASIPFEFDLNSPAAVPEPASFTVLAVLGFGAARRRRKSAS